MKKRDFSKPIAPATQMLVLSAVLAMVGSIPVSASQSSSRGSLSETEVAGKKIFLQTCSLCHLPPANAPQGTAAVGPLLNSLVKDSQSETRAREVILKGSSRMPSYRYSFDAKEMNSLIAYLKTL